MFSKNVLKMLFLVGYIPNGILYFGTVSVLQLLTDVDLIKLYNRKRITSCIFSVAKNATISVMGNKLSRKTLNWFCLSSVMSMRTEKKVKSRGFVKMCHNLCYTQIRI